MNSDIPDLPLEFILIILIISGAFGGVVSTIFEVIDKYKTHFFDEEFRITNFDANYTSITLYYVNRIIQIFFIFAGKASIGIAGAFGAALVGIWIGKVSVIDTVDNKIFLISLSVVAGVISHRLLPQIGQKLEEQLLAKKITEVDKKTDSAIMQSHNAVEYSAAIAHAETALVRNAYNDIPQAIERLNKIRSQFRKDRTLHIYLGRLYRALTEYDKAITVLRDFIKAVSGKSKISLYEEMDLSDAYFNIACYHSLKASNTVVDIEKKRLVSEAITALKSATEIWPGNKEYAKKDPDFDFIKENEEFKKTIS